MTRISKTLTVALTTLMLTAQNGAAAAQSLRDDKQIDDGLTVIAAGDMIQKYCDTISPRWFAAYSFARSLESRAKSLGFSDQEIEDYVENKAEKARVKGQARAYLVSQGLDPALPETYCEVGRYEIERNSQIGVLLKAK